MPLTISRNDVAVLGAELQAAVSMALSRPDLRFLFLSERDVVDGWDLPNVTIRRSAAAAGVAAALSGIPVVVPLSPDWAAVAGQDLRRWSLAKWLGALSDRRFDYVLPVSAARPPGPWLVKGDLFHWPDAPVEGDGDSPGPAADGHRCGRLFQQRLQASAHFLTVGRWAGDERCALGTIRVHQEAAAREAFLLAGETVALPGIESRVRDIMAAAGHAGWFSINWVEDGRGDLWLTSLRPVARALFQLFRKGGIDLLAAPTAWNCLPAGLRFVVDHSYTEYR
jgi:hypothetical protein